MRSKQTALVNVATTDCADCQTQEDDDAPVANDVPVSPDQMNTCTEEVRVAETTGQRQTHPRSGPSGSV